MPASHLWSAHHGRCLTQCVAVPYNRHLPSEPALLSCIFPPCADPPTNPGFNQQTLVSSCRKIAGIASSSSSKGLRPARMPPRRTAFFSALRSALTHPCMPMHPSPSPAGKMAGNTNSSSRSQRPARMPPRQTAFFSALRSVLQQVLAEATPAGRHTRLLAAHAWFVGHRPRPAAADPHLAAAMAASLSVSAPTGQQQQGGTDCARWVPVPLLHVITMTWHGASAHP
jgi:hypothetical protein